MSNLNFRRRYKQTGIQSIGVYTFYIFDPLRLYLTITGKISVLKIQS